MIHMDYAHTIQCQEEPPPLLTLDLAAASLGARLVGSSFTNPSAHNLASSTSVGKSSVPPSSSNPTCEPTVMKTATNLAAGRSGFHETSAIKCRIACITGLEEARMRAATELTQESGSVWPLRCHAFSGLPLSSIQSD